MGCAHAVVLNINKNKQKHLTAIRHTTDKWQHSHTHKQAAKIQMVKQTHKYSKNGREINIKSTNSVWTQSEHSLNTDTQSHNQNRQQPKWQNTESRKNNGKNVVVIDDDGSDGNGGGGNAVTFTSTKYIETELKALVCERERAIFKHSKSTIRLWLYCCCCQHYRHIDIAWHYIQFSLWNRILKCSIFFATHIHMQSLLIYRWGITKLMRGKKTAEMNKRKERREEKERRNRKTTNRPNMGRWRKNICRRTDMR